MKRNWIDAAVVTTASTLTINIPLIKNKTLKCSKAWNLQIEKCVNIMNEDESAAAPRHVWFKVQKSVQEAL